MCLIAMATAIDVTDNTVGNNINVNNNSYIVMLFSQIEILYYVIWETCGVLKFLVHA